MFNLIYYLNGVVERIKLSNVSYLAYPSDRLVNDLSTYIYQRGLILTPEAIRTINKGDMAVLNNDSYIMLKGDSTSNEHVLFGQGDCEWIDIQYHCGTLEQASFYCFPSYGGAIYGKYVGGSDARDKVQVFYFNEESINFLKQINPDITCPQVIVKELLNQKNGILPDDSFEDTISMEAGFTTILNAAKIKFKPPKKLSR